MPKKSFKCSKCVDEINLMIKNGKTISGKQRYICKTCKSTRVENYSYNAYSFNINQQIISLTKEGLGIRSTARFLQISTTILLKRILLIAKDIKPPAIPTKKEYEVDEIRTFLKKKNKLIWIVYALEKESKKVVSFFVGARTNKTLNTVLKTLYFAKTKHIFTDKLRHYK